MLSKLFGALSTGVSTYRTYIVIAMIIASLSSAGWVGYELASSKYKSEIQKILEAELAFYASSILLVQEANNVLHNKKQEIEYITRDVIKEVKVYVDKNPKPAVCNIDAAGLRLWNGEAQSE